MYWMDAAEVRQVYCPSGQVDSDLGDEKTERDRDGERDWGAVTQD